MARARQNLGPARLEQKRHAGVDVDPKDVVSGRAEAVNVGIIAPSGVVPVVPVVGLSCHGT